MTLILAHAARYGVIHVSDRLLTERRTGLPFDLSRIRLFCTCVPTQSSRLGTLGSHTLGIFRPMCGSPTCWSANKSRSIKGLDSRCTLSAETLYPLLRCFEVDSSLRCAVLRRRSLASLSLDGNGHKGGSPNVPTRTTAAHSAPDFPGR